MLKINIKQSTLGVVKRRCETREQLKMNAWNSVWVRQGTCSTKLREG